LFRRRGGTKQSSKKFNEFSSMQLTHGGRPAPFARTPANAGPDRDRRLRCCNAEAHGASVATELKCPRLLWVACKAAARSILANGGCEWQRPRWSGYTTHNE
jgi:hypothetical protein